jgi:sugar phosphate isomerase/epimerase
MVNRLGQAVELADASGYDSVQVVADLFHMNIEESDPPRRSATPVPA